MNPPDSEARTAAAGQAPPSAGLFHSAEALWRSTAALVLWTHFAIAALAVLGGFLVLVHTAWVWLHLPIASWTALVNIANWTCPLTPLEQKLRQRAGQHSYQGGFVEHYIGRYLCPNGITQRGERLIGFGILAWNVVVYGLVLALIR